jgi:uncharacterized peroxidase-related enzyme
MTMKFKTHTAADAPAAAQPILTATQKGLGFVPNLFGTMAAAPALLNAYTTVSKIFDESSLSPTERQIVLLATSRVNNCEYCMAAHTAIAGMQEVAPAIIAAVREGRAIDDPRLEALRQFSIAVVDTRGWPDESMVREFQLAGYGPQQALEVVLGVGMKTLSNYTNHLASTTLDAQFAPAAWSRVA